ncbi:MAG: DUF1957 domain-containing protein [Dehalococcoidia bacterium]|nr:DUF1957 domain-containing protein [Dehalococcoidia bacterium]
MPIGSMTFVLHTHLPYCRLAGRWPHGEEWFHEAMLECYLPLVRAFRRLATEIDGSLGVTINVTPILAEQLGDPLMRDHFREYLAERIDRAREDVRRFAEAGQRGKTAEFHLIRYEGIRAFFENELRGDIISALRDLEASGHIEIATCAATHGYLPLLDNESAVRFQVKTGVESHIRNFGRQPRAFWLPECAYEPGLERYLEEAGLKVFFVETHLVTGGHARGKTLGGVLGPYGELIREVPEEETVELPLQLGTTFKPYHVGDSQVSVLARNERSGLQVWSAAHGYPGDASYREFHKKDGTSGLHYWRVTGPKVDLGDKADYEPNFAYAMARQHADHFRGVVKGEMEAYRSGAGSPGIVMSSYDTELFGHWWLEGVEWLEWAIRGMAADPDVELVSAGDYVTRKPVTEAIALPEGSWGNGGDHRTWLNADTEWTWPEIRQRELRAEPLLKQDTDASRQLARELLLLQSSDWQFLMTTGQAHDYAIERFRSHLERFDRLADAIEGHYPALDALVSEYLELDNPFPAINPRNYAPLPSVSASLR